MKKIIFLMFLISQIGYSQSPWTKEKDHAFVQIGATSLIYDKIKFDSKTIDLNSRITDITTQFYSEFGLTNNLEMQFVLPFKIIDSRPVIGQNTQISGIGNLTFGLKYKLFDSSWKISGGLQYVSNPITKSKNNLSTGFNANTVLPYLTAGSSSGKWYYFGNLGYGYMDNNYSDFMKISAEVGYNITPKSYFILSIDNRIIVSKENAYFNDSAQWSSYLDRQSFSALGLKYNYEFKKDKFGANFAAIGAFRIDNAPEAPTFNIGLYSKL